MSKQYVLALEFIRYPHWRSSDTRTPSHPVLEGFTIIQCLHIHPVLTLHVIRYPHSMSSGTYTQCDPILTLHIIRYSHSKSSGTRRFYNDSVLTLHVIQYLHPISSSICNSTHTILEYSRNHLVPECSRSFGTSINNRSILYYSKKCCMLLEDNRGHGFCP
jgi:hypothetical protein